MKEAKTYFQNARDQKAYDIISLIGKLWDFTFFSLLVCVLCFIRSPRSIHSQAQAWPACTKGRVISGMRFVRIRLCWSASPTARHLCVWALESAWQIWDGVLMCVNVVDRVIRLFAIFEAHRLCFVIFEDH